MPPMGAAAPVSSRGDSAFLISGQRSRRRPGCTCHMRQVSFTPRSNGFDPYLQTSEREPARLAPRHR
jgi:hypothetical protein